MRDLIPRLVLGQLRSSLTQSLLTVLGVSLATAVVVSVYLADRAALSSFRDSALRVSGRSSFLLASDGPTFDEKILSDLSWTRHWGGMFPRVEGRLMKPENPSEILVLLGLDLLKDRDVRDLEILGAGGRVLSRDERFSALARINTVYLSERYAQKTGLEVGKETLFTVLGRPVTLRVAGLLSDAGVGGAYGGRVAVMDLGAAQSFLGLNGKLNYLDFVVSPDADIKTLAARLKKEMPPGFRLEEPRESVDRAERMLRPVRFHLSILSLLSLLVGAFWMYHRITNSVLRRRDCLGTLRTLGLTAAGLRGWVLAEAACLTFVGTLLGLLGGRLAAMGVVRMVGALWTRLVLSVPVASELPSQIGGWAVALGAFVFMTLGVLPVAWQSSRIPPGFILRPVEKKGVLPERWKAKMLMGVWLLCLAGMGVRLPLFGGLPWGVVAAMLCLLSASYVLAPCFLRGMNWLARPFLSRLFSAEAWLAWCRLQSGTRRSGSAVGLVGVGVGLMVSTVILAGSFRSTLKDSAADAFRADLNVRAEPLPGLADASLDPIAVEAVKTLPGVAAVDASFSFTALEGERMIRIRADDTRVLAEHGRLSFLGEGESSRILAKLPGRLSVVLSEPLARHFQLKAGDFFTLHTPSGVVPLEISGVYKDASDLRGTLLMDRGTYRSLYRDPSVNELSVYGNPDNSIETLRQAVRQEGLATGGWHVRSNSEVRESILGNVDGFFVLAAVMGFIALFLAGLGVFSALTALRWENPQEAVLLRTLGAVPSQVKGIGLWEAGILGALGCVLGCVVGWMLSWILVKVLVVQSFGWTLRLLPPIPLVAGTVGLVWLFTLLAGFVPAGAVSRIPPLRAMNRE